MSIAKRGGADGGNADQNGPSFARLVEWLDAHANTLLDDPRNNLIGVGIGKKSAGPIDDDAPFCVTGFVEKKLPKNQVEERGLPLFSQAAASVSRVGSAEALDFEIDVVETGSPFRTHSALEAPAALRGVYGGNPPILDLQKRFQVLRAGLGITNPHNAYPNNLSVGTLGFFVRDDAGKIYLVSNNHVIGRENHAKSGEAVVQPGTLDLTSTELSSMNRLGKLKAQLEIAKVSALVKIGFHGPTGIPFNEVDGAIAELTDSGRTLSEIARVGLGGKLTGVAAQVSVDAVTGQVTGPTRVYKAGRTTGWTEGDITQVAIVADIPYSGGPARFRNQIGVAASPDNTGPFSAAGDSGSGVLNADHELVGLLFAGSPARTLINPIHRVFSDLQSALGVGSLTLVT